MKPKIIIHAAILLFLSSCSSKMNDDQHVSDPKKAILGKWELVADGMYEDEMNERDHGAYWEFLPDGTARTYLPGYFPAQPEENRYGLFIGIGKYEIDADLLVRKYCNEDGFCYWEDCYKYEFSKDQLKLTKDPKAIRDTSENLRFLYIAYFLNFKQIK